MIPWRIPQLQTKNYYPTNEPEIIVVLQDNSDQQIKSRVN